MDFVFQPIRDGDDAVTAVVEQWVDVTCRVREQKRREALYRLTDLVGTAEDQLELGCRTSEIIGQPLCAARVGLSQIDPESKLLFTERDWTAEGMTSVASLLPLRADGWFIDSLKAGGSEIDDVRKDPRTRSPLAAADLEAYQTRAFASVPILKRGRSAAVLMSTAPIPAIGRNRTWILPAKPARRVWRNG